jgi:Flp pilus assembly protein TadG
MGVGRSACSFLEDRRGNIAMMFGILLFVIVGAAGIAIDLQRSSMIRSAVHEAADAGILAAARYKANHPNADDTELTDVARRVFDNAMRDGVSPTISSFAVSFDSADETFALDVVGTSKTLMMGVLGQDYSDVGARSEVKLGKPALLEVAMALDVTGSMNQQGKISALRNSAKDLIESLFESDEADVKIGIVPFAQYVNIGASYAGQSWLTVPTGPSWMGCIGSRDYPNNVEDDDYSASPVPGLNGIACPDSLMPLSTDEDALKDKIDDLDANGWTYIPSGLMWAWSLLTPGEPFSEGISFADMVEGNGSKAIIVMTDGENTRAPDYPTHNSASEVLANQLTEELCVNIKRQDIVIYSIAFDVSDADIRAILEECATSTSHYFDAEDAGDLADAFEAIATSLRNISLSK